MVTLYHVEFFTLYKVGFRLQSWLPTTGMGLEWGSGSVNVNKSLQSLSAEFPNLFLCGRLCRWLSWFRGLPTWPVFLGRPGGGEQIPVLVASGLREDIRRRCRRRRSFDRHFWFRRWCVLKYIKKCLNFWNFFWRVIGGSQRVKILGRWKDLWMIFCQPVSTVWVVRWWGHLNLNSYNQIHLNFFCSGEKVELQSTVNRNFIFSVYQKRKQQP